MRRTYKEVLLLIFCLLIGSALPALTALIFGQEMSAPDYRSDERPILFYRHESDQTPIELTMRELLVGTLAAYNASDTPLESLKAQAVALRSRAYCLIGYCKDEADTLCDSSSHGFAYADVGQLASVWGHEEASARLEAAGEAVMAVNNEVLCYEDGYVLALTHSSSPSETKEMEGYPYLASVTTPESGEVSELALTRRDFAAIAAEKLGISCPDDQDWEITLSCEENGRVEQVTIGDRKVDGDIFAEAFELPSDTFTLTVNDMVRFTCRGVGSGYGLSRVGAGLYGSQGLSYEEILLHYFPGTRLTDLWE